MRYTEAPNGTPRRLQRQGGAHEVLGYQAEYTTWQALHLLITEDTA